MRDHDDYTAYERELRDPVDRANPSWHPSLGAHPSLVLNLPKRPCGECGVVRGADGCACDPHEFADQADVIEFRRRITRHKADWNVR